MIRLQIRYVGRVQGVGFRATVHAIARAHPVTGWVRNEPDGSVLLECQGDPHALATFRQAIRDRMARNITAEHELDALPDPSEPDFAIRR